MQRLKIENQVQLAHILKQPVQGFDEDLDEIEEGERGFGGGGDDDEVERGVVPVGDERGSVVVLLTGLGVVAGGGCEEWWEREEVAGAGGACGDEGEDFGEESLLDRGVLCMC